MRSLLLFVPFKTIQGNNFSSKGSSIYLISSQITSLGIYYAKYFGGGGEGGGDGNDKHRKKGKHKGIGGKIKKRAGKKEKIASNTK